MWPITRFVVSLPAVASMLTKMRSSSWVRHRTVPVSSSNSAWMSWVMRSSDGFSLRQLMYSSKNAASANWSSLNSPGWPGSRRMVSSLCEPHVLLVLLGDAEQHADHPHRHPGTEVADEVETVGADQRIEHLGAQVADLGLEGVHLPGREDPGQETAVGGVDRRVLEDEHAGRQLDVHLDQLEDPALSRAERPGVLHHALDVVEAAHGEEVVLLVVVERRLLPHAAEDRIRIALQLEVVRVVVDLVGHDVMSPLRPGETALMIPW